MEPRPNRDACSRRRFLPGSRAALCWIVLAVPAGIACSPARGRSGETTALDSPGQVLPPFPAVSEPVVPLPEAPPPSPNPTNDPPADGRAPVTSPLLCAGRSELTELCPEAIRCDERGCSLSGTEGGSAQWGPAPSCPDRPRPGGAAGGLRVEGFEALGPEALREALARELDELACCLGTAAGPDAAALALDATWTLTVCAGPDGTVVRSCVGSDRALATTCVREMLARLDGLALPARSPPAAVRVGLRGFLPY